VEETIDEIETVVHQRNGQIGILATLGTIRSDLYQTALSNRGLIPLTPPESTQHEVHGAIIRVKGQVERDESKRRIERAVRFLSEGGAQGVILGCTELGLVRDLSVDIPVFDSLKILVKAALREAMKT
jgi:aspartate racemase